jgi:Fe-S cluster biogenesis protein NfuA
MENRPNNETRTKIGNVLDKVRPFIQSHGGDVNIVGLKGKKVILRVSGRCTHCLLADLTFNHMVKDMIMESAPEIETIEFQNAHTL